MKLKPPIVKYLPSREDLVMLDAVINSVGAEVRPEADDIYMRFQHRRQSIGFVDEKIKGLGDEDIDQKER